MKSGTVKLIYNHEINAIRNFLSVREFMYVFKTWEKTYGQRFNKCTLNILYSNGTEEIGLSTEAARLQMAKKKARDTQPGSV